MAKTILTICISVVRTFGVYILLMITFLLALPGHAQTFPQFTLQGEFTTPFEHLNVIPEEGLDINDDNIIDIKRHCGCRLMEPFANGSIDNNGIFDDQLIIATGVTGQQWELGNHTNVLDPITLAALPIGTLIPEVGTTGVYVLPFAYNESTPYSAEAYEAATPNDLFGPVSDQCFYPDPIITAFDSFFCDNSEDQILTSTTSSGFMNNTILVNPSSVQWTIFPDNGGPLINGPFFSPEELSEGTYTIKHFFYGDENPYAAIDKTGCLSIVEKDFIVREGNGLICNNSVNISISPNDCETVITPSMLLSGTPITFDGYTVNVVVAGGTLLNDTIPSEYIGQTLTGILTDECAGTYCSVNINLNDPTPPVMGDVEDITLPCTQEYDPAAILAPTTSDCAPVTLTYEDDITDNGCANPKIHIIRTWKAEDPSGNITTKTQNIYIERGTQAELRFPQDIFFECSEYLNDNSVIDPTTAGMPNLVNDEHCDFVYTFSDNILPTCGSNTTSFSIIRTWTVLDECNSTLYTVDGIGNDNVQIITVRDQTAPTITTQELSTLSNIPTQENNNEGCLSTGLIPAPNVSDECNDYEVRIFTSIGEVSYVNGINGNNGGHIPAPGLPLGIHTIDYEVTDACGNTTHASTSLSIRDETLPVMICDNSISITLNQNGNGFITPANIDEGSRDNCCLANLLIKETGQPDTAFDDILPFFCTNDTIEVTIRAIDCEGNFNECTSNIIVSDPISPYVVSSPVDVTLNCESTYEEYLDATFDAPTFEDNCNYTTTYETILQTNSCGAGQLLRIWTARDNPFNTPARDTQIIIFALESDYDIILPNDQIIDCNQTNNFDDVSFESRACEMLVVNTSTDTLDATAEGFCSKIRRQHQIINWCEYGDGTPSIVLPRQSNAVDTIAFSYLAHSDGDQIYQNTPFGLDAIDVSSGHYIYDQYIYIADDESPTLSASPIPITCIESAEECLGFVSYQFEANDNCDDLVSATHRFQNNGSIPATDEYGILSYLPNGNVQIEGNYPAGQNNFIITLTDECGNESNYDRAFTVQDCLAPTLTCADSVILHLPESGELLITTEHVLGSVSDNCELASFSLSPDSLLSSITLDCDNVGFNTIPLYAKDVAGNESQCSFFVELRDTNTYCEQYFTIDGYIRNINGEGIPNTEVSLIADNTYTVMTDTSGYYQFEDVVEGENYRLVPRKLENFPNGVTTFDIIKVRKHILLITLFDEAHDFIAADVNRSNGISTFDIIKMQKMILLITDDVPENTSWRFVDNSYQFNDPTNPLVEDFPEAINNFTLDNNQQYNFTGIKIADLNTSATLE